MTSVRVTYGGLTERAATVGSCAAEVGELVPRLAAGLAGSGLELLPAAGLPGRVAVATDVGGRLLPTTASLPWLAAELAGLGSALGVAGLTYAAADTARATAGATAETADHLVHQLLPPLGALAMVDLWDAEHLLLPRPLQPAGAWALDGLDVLVEGRARVHRLPPAAVDRLGVDPRAVTMGTASPAAALRAVDALSRPAAASTVAVLRVAGVGAPPRFVVCLPGLQHASATDGSAADLPGAVATLTGHSSYVAGAAAIIASLPRGSRVLLVGHSQGGMVAQAVAADHRLAGTGVHVDALLTAGSPRLADNPPATTIYLALEGSGDPVPRLRGLAAGLVLPPLAQPADAERTLVRFPSPRRPLSLRDHGLVSGGYVAVAASDDPPVTRFRDETAAWWGRPAAGWVAYRITDRGTP